jgi:hypothetical protein
VSPINPTTIVKYRSVLSAALAALVLTFYAATPQAWALVSVAVQPASQVALVGSNAVFTAQANADAGETITGYSWLMSTNGQAPFVTLPGATGPVCTLTNVQAADSGFYMVSVSNRYGGNILAPVSSAAVTLTVHDQARLTRQPQGGLVRATGASAALSVAALGEALHYQWRLNKANLVNGDRSSGVDTATLELMNLALGDAGKYDVVVTNLYGAVTSQVATLSVFTPPVDTTVIAGSNAAFSLTVGGSTPLTFSWQKNGTVLVDDGHLSGTSKATLGIANVTTNDAAGYSVAVASASDSVTSAVATLTVLEPAVITSPGYALGRQGAAFSYSILAAGTLPISFGAEGLPLGLSLDSTNGLISGIPLVAGVFTVTLFASNVVLTATAPLVVELTTGVPGITSPLAVGGQQGQSFSYRITASNDPVAFSASALPTGLSFDSLSGLITGVPIVSGSFPLTIGATNQFGGDLQTLALSLTSSVPVITSALSATGQENQGGFSYTIKATGSPFRFEAAGLPLGLGLNATNGVIAGTPLYGGTYTVLLSAQNAWGVGTTNLVLNLAYATAGGLAIADVAHTYSAPYLLDFAFSLRDNTNAGASSPVVRPPSSLQVVCLEGGQPIPGETALILDKGDKKQLRSFLVLDYTYSLFAMPGAIDAMQEAAKLLINEEPAHALFGIEEFHADYSDPHLVTTNGFTADKAALSRAIDGIQNTYVQGDYAGTRCWDAMYAALGQFGPTNRDETRYLVVLTDGNDDSSWLNTNANPVATLVGLAQTNQVRIFCVAFGSDVNSNALEQLTSQTLGHYYVAATTADLALQYQKIVKDIDGQYLLRWATLQRAAKPFQPSFQVTVDGVTAWFNKDPIYQTNSVVTTNTDVTPPTVETNLVVTNLLSLPYNPPDWAGNVKAGGLRLVADADLGPQTIRLRTTYTPRYVREIRLNYRPNYPCTVSLDSTATNELLYGWGLVETNDGTGGKWLTATSPSPTNLLTSIKYGALGDLLSFHFQYPESLTATQAFSVFQVDNGVYSNMPPSGQSFTLENATNFLTVYPEAPPHGTPIPWLWAHGFTNNFATAELSDPNGNGLAVWQEYLAGLDPRAANSGLAMRFQGPPLGWPQVTFDTVATRTYRVETATPLGHWTPLLDNIAGTGSPVTVVDYRDLSTVREVFYRVVVY